jgi:hypothetical protein
MSLKVSVYIIMPKNNGFDLNYFLKSLSSKNANQLTQASNEMHLKEIDLEKKANKPPMLLADALIKKQEVFPYSDLIKSIEEDRKRLGNDEFKNIWIDTANKISKLREGDVHGSKDWIENTSFTGQTFINSLSDQMLGQFKENPDKTFIFSSSLTDALKTVNLNVKLKHLPKNICAFFCFPELFYYDTNNNLKNHIEGVLVQTQEDEKKGLLVSMVVFSKNYYGGQTDSNINYFSSEQMDDAISSSIKSNRHKEAGNQDGPLFVNNNEDIIFMTFAGLVYLSSQKDSVNNQFIQGKAQLLRKKYSSCSYYLLGEGIKLVRKTTTDSWEVSAHPRWQPCGPGFSQTKLIFIQNHFKKFQPIYVEDPEALEQDSDRPLYTQWEKMDRNVFIPKFKGFLDSLGVEYKLEEEYQVRKESLHKIDYVLKIPKKGLVIGIEYKSSKASWSRIKIEEQRVYYHFHLDRRYMGTSIFPRSRDSYGVVETFLVSDDGKYGVSESDLMSHIEKILQ